MWKNIKIQIETSGASFGPFGQEREKAADIPPDNVNIKLVHLHLLDSD